MVAAAVVGGALVGGVASSHATKSAAQTAANAQTQAAESSSAAQIQAANTASAAQLQATNTATAAQLEASKNSTAAQLEASKNSTAAYLEAAKNATAAQSEASKLGISQQDKQFAAIQKLLEPYSTAGTGALTGQQDLLGMNGNAAQQSAITGINNSAQFGTLVKQGEDSILANASATGGLRGGNVQGALAQFRPALLNQLIDQQYARLGGITSIGQNAATSVGNAGITTGNNITSLLSQQGQSAAANAMAAGNAIAGGATATGNAIAGGATATGNAIAGGAVAGGNAIAGNALAAGSAAAGNYATAGSAAAGSALAAGQANANLYNGIGSAFGSYVGMGGFGRSGAPSNELF